MLVMQIFKIYVHDKQRPFLPLYFQDDYQHLIFLCLFLLLRAYQEC